MTQALEDDSTTLIIPGPDEIAIKLEPLALSNLQDSEDQAEHSLHNGSTVSTKHDFGSPRRNSRVRCDTADTDTDCYVTEESRNYFLSNESSDYSKLGSYPKHHRTWQKVSYRRNSGFQSEMDENHFCAKLYHTKRKILHLKNYHDEARAMRDISKFVKHPIVLFKIHHTLWEDIAKEMIVTLAEEKPDLNLDIELTLKSVTSKDADFVIPECVQGISESPHGPVTEQSFITVIGITNAVTDSQVVMCLLKQPFNFGIGAEEIRFVCLVLAPIKHTKHTKSALEVARTYSTLFADDRLRRNLLNTHSPEEFAHEFELECSRIQIEHQKRMKRLNAMPANLKVREYNSSQSLPQVKESMEGVTFVPGRDLLKDIENRAKHYFSDYFGDLKDGTSIQKIISTTLFLYFALLLPGIAFGVLHSKYTDGKIDSKDVVVAQALSGLLFSIFSGQHLVVITTTIPVVIYTKIVYIISQNWDDADGSFFQTFYMMTGISNAFFLILYAFCGASKIMAYCSRSTEEILELFISVAFIVDSVKFLKEEFSQNYCFDTEEVLNVTKRAAAEIIECDPTRPILTLLLICLTVYVGVQIFNFKNSPYLTAGKRLLVADYALVVAVAAGAFVGSYCFQNIELTKFVVDEDKPLFKIVDFRRPPVMSVLAAIGLGFVVSFLFFMEGNISASIVNKPSNKLKKGSSFHYDMFVTGVINAILSIFCLPWLHGALPHSPLHVRALADIEEHIENGHVTETIVYVRETRLTTLVAHIFIGASVLMIPYPLNLIPIPVLYGLFVFLAVTSLGELQIWERFVLIFTEQSLYPPFHYVRKVPQKIIHCFTLLQMMQLTALCLVSFGNSAYLKMLFPFIIVSLIPIREWVLPKIISKRHLLALDGDH
ncbi:solute carrier family 4 member 11-like isoform X2 [Bolinopsis microptera]|uniref:solute carrier family 4 member 11-like isoform X2 n=1 Tax=Bolinopsis microptera TaxID=2820187 RepID=UPI00307A6444